LPDDKAALVQVVVDTVATGVLPNPEVADVVDCHTE
jgi:hypothetical protein